jgi:hypothetical protein
MNRTEAIVAFCILVLLILGYAEARRGENSRLALKECQEAVAAIQQQNDWLRGR